MKQITSLALIWTMVSAFVPGEFPREQTAAAQENSGQDTILFEDFEGYEQFLAAPWEPFSSSFASGNAIRHQVAQRDDGSKYLKISPKSAWPYYVKRTVNAQAEGRYLLSFETMADGFMNEDGTRESLTSSVNLQDKEGNVFSLFRWETAKLSNGNIDLTICLGNSPLGQPRELEMGKWCSIEVFLDMDCSYAVFSMDGQRWGETKFTDTMKDIEAIAVRAVASSPYSVENPSPVCVGFDNIGLHKLTQQTAKLRMEQGKFVPEYLTQPIIYQIDTPVTGNIFSDRNISFTIKADNTCQVPVNDSAIAVIYNESGQEVQKQYVNFAAAAEGTENFIVAFDNVPYGIYTLQISDSLGSMAATQFSVARVPKSGAKNEKIGLDTDFSHDERGSVEKVMELVDKSGVGITREQFTWSLLDPDATGISMPEKLKNYIEVSRQSGIDIFPISAFSNPAYTSESPPVSDNAQEAYANYCAQLAAALQGTGNYIEIWNEFLLDGFNKDHAAPEDYARMLQKVYPKIKAANPAAKVCAMVTPNISDTALSGAVEGMSSLQWIRKVMEYLCKNGGINCFDVISVHPYMSCYPDTDDLIMKRNYDNLKSLMNEFGVGEMPVIASEVGWSTTDVRIGERSQAAATVRLGILNDVYSLYDKLILFNIQRFKDDRSNRNANFGIINSWFERVPYSARPAYLALCNYNRLMADAEFEAICDGAGNARIYRFRTAEGDTLYAMWSLNGTCRIHIDAQKPFALLCDMMGNEQEIASASGDFGIILNEEVQYLLVPSQQNAILAGNGQIAADHLTVSPIDTVAVYSDAAANADTFVMLKKEVGIDGEMSGIELQPEEELLAFKGAGIQNEFFHNSEMHLKQSMTEKNSDQDEIEDSERKIMISGDGASGTQVTSEISNINVGEYQWQISDAPYKEFVNLEYEDADSLAIKDSYVEDRYIRLRITAEDGQRYYSNIMKLWKKEVNWPYGIDISSMTPETPSEYIFRESGDEEKSFIFLDRCYEDGEDRYYILRNDYAPELNMPISTSGSMIFDENDQTGIAWNMNQSEFIASAVASKMVSYIPVAPWKVDSSWENTHYVNEKLLLLSVEELRAYAQRIGCAIGTHWWLRSPAKPNNPESKAYRCISENSVQQKQVTYHAISSTAYPRAAFYLTRDYFINTHLQTDDMGEEIRKLLREDFKREELEHIYTSEELDAIFDGAAASKGLSDGIIAKFQPDKMGTTEIYLWSELNLLQPLTHKLTIRVDEES